MPYSAPLSSLLVLLIFHDVLPVSWLPVSQSFRDTLLLFWPLSEQLVPLLLVFAVDRQRAVKYRRRKKIKRKRLKHPPIHQCKIATHISTPPVLQIKNTLRAC